AVQEHDPLETRGGERGAQVPNHRHERRNTDVRQPREPDVRIGQRVIDGRGDEGADLGRNAARHLVWNEHVGQERPMRSVLLGGASWNDDCVTIFQEFLDFRGGHLAEKYARRPPQELVSGHTPPELIVTDSIIWSDGDEVIEIHYIGLDSPSPAV